MNLRSIDLNLLTIFDAVIREENYTRAAENLCMSQPAVSDAVVRLRHLFKDELFVRTGRGVRPTPRALQYAPQVRPSRMAYPMAEAYDLTCFPIPIPDMEVPAYMSWHTSFNVDPGLAWLRNAITVVLRGDDLDED